MPPALKLISLQFSNPVCPCVSNFPQGAVTILRIFPWLVFVALWRFEPGAACV